MVHTALNLKLICRTINHHVHAVPMFPQSFNDFIVSLRVQFDFYLIELI